MKRVALVTSEPIRARMGGIGVRYVEMARHLEGGGRRRVELLSPSPPDVAAAQIPPGVVYRPFELASLRRVLAESDVVVTQGQLANDVLLADPAVPVAVDLYDPFLVEHFQYLESLGLDPYRNDHTSWLLQLSRGDFFLCSSPEQRLYYLGFLTAVGRVNPERAAADADLRGLIEVVPFALPAERPPYRPLLPAAAPGVRRLLFGALYDWYDPETLLDALERLGSFDWRLLLVRHPNPDSTPQRRFAEIEARCRRSGWWGERVEVLDWVPAERRFDLLAEVDALVAPHRPTLETALSLRTRFVEALAVGCPVVTTEGGALEPGAAREIGRLGGSSRRRPAPWPKRSPRSWPGATRSSCAANAGASSPARSTPGRRCAARRLRRPSAPRRHA
ncbi:MAG: glycosyltransferase [Thermoanaerobaculia bacterium]